MTPKALPVDAARLLNAHGAPPRLRAHLILVHDMATALVDAVAAAWPQVVVDREAILFGAAVHDIGKIVHMEELSGPGSAHEEAGYRLLIADGVPERLARFARTHGQWPDRDDISLEDLLVALADRVWRGKRDETLEERVAQLVAIRSGEELWQVWLRLDDLLTEIAADAGARLAWQANHPI